MARISACGFPGNSADSYKMTTTLFVPAAIEYQNELATALAAVKAAGVKAFAQTSLLRAIAEKVEAALEGVEELNAARQKADAVSDVEKKAAAYCEDVKPLFETIRAQVDALELLMPAVSWPVPKYREMLFLM